jgi:predicted Rossmann fold nucleotide-binding protein DprA/Smf involved in DNA uptake
VRNRS